MNWLDLFIPMERNKGHKARNFDLLFGFFISASKGLSICFIIRRMETSAGEGQRVHVARQIPLMTHGRCDCVVEDINFIFLVSFNAESPAYASTASVFIKWKRNLLP